MSTPIPGSPTPGNPIEVREVQTTPTAKRRVVYFNNSELYLAGIFPQTARLDGDFGPILDALSTRHNNFFRQYVTNYFLYQYDTHPIRTPTGEDQRRRYSPFLWHGKGDPMDAHKEKWDLTKFNDDYFTRLRSMLSAARDRGIVVQLTLFDGAGMRFADRWPYSPWKSDRNINGVVNSASSAMPTFYTGRDTPAVDGDGKATTLGRIQDAFVREVATRTLDFWNVVFEIMNEPTDATPAQRAAWGDQIVAALDSVTKGRRLIFYNDHSQGTGGLKGGLDVNAWRSLPNYRALDGVIFHGDPNIIVPEQVSAWQFVGEKVIQASSDTFTDPVPGTNRPLREDRAWNRQTASTLFTRHIVYQAEAGEGGQTAAADGIQRASPPPTQIVYPAFYGDWTKTSADAPYFHLRFDADGRYFAIRPADDTVIDQGRVVRFSKTQFVTAHDGQAGELTFNYAVSADGQQLTYTHAQTGRQQTFRRFAGDIAPFLYGWRKVGENPATAAPRYLLYFRQDGTMLARDEANPANVLNQGRVVSIANDPPRLAYQSATFNATSTYAYVFFDQGRFLRLTNVDNGRVQDFARTAEGLPA